MLTINSELVAAYENLEKKLVPALKELKKKEEEAYEAYKKTIAEQSARHASEEEEKTIRKEWLNAIDAEERKLESEWNKTAERLNRTLSLLDALRR
ncbi:MAG: hypothetical protein A3G41_04150 [Elusimicrobia bacterium RIFCSPLOWO2_12_FULL_59_9]|nr:MAG: hypothetical protein A3G41_04150 [Elusimicrobia bacterium RIFCSPLOWO2_12_FULL_59_9]